jgi:hypothetical protein
LVFDDVDNGADVEDIRVEIFVLILSARSTKDEASKTHIRKIAAAYMV